MNQGVMSYALLRSYRILSVTDADEPNKTIWWLFGSYLYPSTIRY